MCDKCNCMTTDDSYSPHWTEMSKELDQSKDEYEAVSDTLQSYALIYPMTYEGIVKLYNYFTDLTVVGHILQNAVQKELTDGVPYEFALDTCVTEYLDSLPVDDFSIEVTGYPDVVEPTGVNPLDVQVAGKHYKKGIQPIEYAHVNGLDPNQKDIVAYITRFREKGGIEDLKKVVHYAQIIAFLEYGRTITVHPVTGEVMDLEVCDE